MNAKEIGGRIEEARLAAGIKTQAELARRLDLRQSSIHKWESGMAFPRLSRIGSLASALDVKPVWLLFGDIQACGESMVQAS